MIDTFMDKIIPIPESGCWAWLGPVNNDGYGALYSNRKTHMAHRFFYEQIKGNIPKNMVLDHKCRVRSCVNPDHLEPVTLKENVRRGKRGIILQTHCKRGHELNKDTVWIAKRLSNVSGIERICKLCDRERKLKYKKDKK